MNGRISVPTPINEPISPYTADDPRKASLKTRLAELRSQELEIPLIIGGEEVRTGNMGSDTIPHDHGHELATYHKAGPEEVRQAIAAAAEAQKEWSRWSLEERAGVFLRAADLLATTWRDTLNAATMLGQSKSCYQAEIDAACELIDFFRFNAHFAQRIYEEQPQSAPGMWNHSEYRPLEGFVYAITPFNFTSIAGNLPAAPALMGNTVIWKPSTAGVFSSYYLAKLFEAAGLPPGVINFVPGNASEMTETLLADPGLAGIHFTGSTGVFQNLWSAVGSNIANYRSYPRLVGETGGKNFIVAHASADADAVQAAIVRGGYEYQGQKCSAASRVYVPKSMWSSMRGRLVAEIESIKIAVPADFTNFMSAVIHRRAFDKISGYIERAQNAGDAEVIAGGQSDGSVGFFIRPTLIEVAAPAYESMCDEIFGPVVTVHVYPDKEWSETLHLVERTSPYALTGAVFGQDRAAIQEADDVLVNAAGNFYINDKPTGAVVGQQPFGGARASGTNDKAGSMLNLIRWVSARTVKETFVPATDYRYPFLAEE